MFLTGCQSFENYSQLSFDELLTLAWKHPIRVTSVISNVHMFLARQTNLVNTCFCSHNPKILLTYTKQNYWNVPQIESFVSWPKWFQATLKQRAHDVEIHEAIFLSVLSSNLKEIYKLECVATKHEMLHHFKGRSSTVALLINKDQSLKRSSLVANVFQTTQRKRVLRTFASIATAHL